MLALVRSVLVLCIVPFIHGGIFRGLAFYPFNQALYWSFVGNFFLLRWLGSCPVEEPFILAGQVRRCFYFLYFLLAPLFIWLQDFLMIHDRPVSEKEPWRFFGWR